MIMRKNIILLLLAASVWAEILAQYANFGYGKGVPKEGSALSQQDMLRNENAYDQMKQQKDPNEALFENFYKREVLQKRNSQ